jgi:O-antigen biosynthesis protein WbqV
MLGHSAETVLSECAPEFFVGKSVLITGAGGSVGSSLAMQLAHQGCARLGLLDHFDHGLLDIAERAKTIAPDLDVVDALCDIRDIQRLGYWLDQFKPDVVIHAAALKHVHLGERHSIECVHTNLMGVSNVIEAAANSGAQDFLLVSSDKAASPVCVMGATKRLAELYLIGCAAEKRSGMRLRSVRFGNVYGSQGSVTPRFAAQIAEGGPLLITHQDMQRFFMTAEDAVRLILGVTALDAGADDLSGVYYMDMGEPVSILELGRQMIRESGKKIPIEYIGLRPGEKIREELFDSFEVAASCSLYDVYRVQPKSASAYVTEADLLRLRETMASMDDAHMRRAVFALLDERLGRRYAIAS